MFTCLFEGATSNGAELDYKIRHDAPRRESVSFIYDSYMQYHESIPWVLLALEISPQAEKGKPQGNIKPFSPVASPTGQEKALSGQSR